MHALRTNQPASRVAVSSWGCLVSPPPAAGFRSVGGALGGGGAVIDSGCSSPDLLLPRPAPASIFDAALVCTCFPGHSRTANGWSPLPGTLDLTPSRTLSSRRPGRQLSARAGTLHSRGRVPPHGCCGDLPTLSLNTTPAHTANGAGASQHTPGDLKTSSASAQETGGCTLHIWTSAMDPFPVKLKIFPPTFWYHESRVVMH